MVWEGDEGAAGEKEWQESIVGDAERHGKEGLMGREDGEEGVFVYTLQNIVYILHTCQEDTYTCTTLLSPQ